MRTRQPFQPRVVDLADEISRTNFKKIWPIGKFPVLRDDANDRTIPESSIIIEYLAQHYPGRIELVPTDAELATQTRMWDRFYDLYVGEPMQKIVTDRLRPAGMTDPYGVEQARAALQTAYAVIERQMGSKLWAMGDAFSMADCAAAPSLFYAQRAMPFCETHENVAAYLTRLMERESFARVVKEAQPYFGAFPG